jgi:hypothetical protein
MAAAMLMSAAISRFAYGAPPANADQSLAPWFQSLHNPTFGFSCCSVADCRGPKEYPVRIREGAYEVWVDQEWMPVPKEAVSERMDNPTGDYVTCVQENYWESGIRKPKVLCLFKAPRT